MKVFLNVIANFLYACMVIWEIIEFLFLPILFVLLGLYLKLPWQYYLITVGGYAAIFLLIDIGMRILFKHLDRKYSSIVERKLEKIIDRFTKKSNDSNADRTDDNYIKFD